MVHTGEKEWCPKSVYPSVLPDDSWLPAQNTYYWQEVMIFHGAPNILGVRNDAIHVFGIILRHRHGSGAVTSEGAIDERAGCLVWDLARTPDLYPHLYSRYVRLQRYSGMILQSGM